MIENDRTRNMATAAVIVAGIRSGGTFLAHCLSNHSQVFCERGEPLHRFSIWFEMLNPDQRKLLSTLLNQTGYPVSMCKLTYGQAFRAEIWAWLKKAQPKVVWLRRENAIQQALSVFVNKQARKGQLKRPQHTFEQTLPVPVAIKPDYLLRMARGLVAQDQGAARFLLGALETLSVTYEEITRLKKPEYSARGIDPEAGKKISEFLGIRNEEMPSDLMRVNPGPLCELIANWPQVRKAVLASEFAELVDD